MIDNTQKPCTIGDGPDKSNEQGFTLLETSIALVVMMVVTLATGSLFVYAVNYNSGAGDRSAAMTAARSLRSGMTSINSVLGFAIVPALPFGGVGESGFGRIHGADGLREFSRAKAITRQRMRPLIALTTFGRTDRDMRRIVTLVTLLHGRLYRPRRSAGGKRRAR
jgi:hypothetical protein